MVLVATTEFSELLISARKDAGIESPSDAARRLGITPQRLGNWENGISQPKYDMLKMISELYGVPIGYFFGIPEESPQPGFPPPVPYRDGKSHPKVGRRMFPVLGQAGASEFPIHPGDAEDYVEFSDDLHSSSVERFAVRVKGPSMKFFKTDDFALLHPDEAFKEVGKYVVARSPETEFVVKLLGRQGSQFMLCPETEGFNPIPIDDPAWRIVGKVVGHKREKRFLTRTGALLVRSYFEFGDNDGLSPANYP